MMRTDSPLMSRIASIPHSVLSSAIFVTLFVSYISLYFCRTDFSVANSLMLNSEAPEDAFIRTQADIGAIITPGTFLYALGKFSSGYFGSKLGPVTTALIGMGGAVVFTCIFALGKSLPVLIVSWSLNRGVQALVWTCFVSIISKWFPPTRRGIAISLLSLSVLGGDALARVVLSTLMAYGMPWRTVFFCCAALMSVVTFAASCVFWVASKAYVHTPLLRDDSRAAPLVETPPVGYSMQLRRLLITPAFWIMCLVAASIHFVREILTDWLQLLLESTGDVSSSMASLGSAMYPLSGVVSTVLCGYISDHSTGQRRGLIMMISYFVAAASMGMMWFVSTLEHKSFGWLVTCIFGAGFGLYGPRALLSAVCLDVCEYHKIPVPVFLGTMDAFGYTIASTSGLLIGYLVEMFGWSAALATLVAVSSCGVFLLWIYAFVIEPKIKTSPAYTVVPVDISVSEDAFE